MNCMIPEAEVSRGKAHQKVFGQTTAQLKVLFGQDCGREGNKMRRDKRGMGRE